MVTSLLIALALLTPCLSSNQDYLTQQLVELYQTLQHDTSQECSLHLVMGSKKAVYSYQCGGHQGDGTLTVRQAIEDQQHDMHVFQLFAQSQAAGSVSCVSKYGLEWSFNITVEVGSKRINVEGVVVQHQYTIVWFVLLYSVAASVVLPFTRDYYLYMSSLSIFSFLLSILLSVSVLANICVIIFKYAQLAKPSQPYPFFLIFLLLLCFFVALVHLHHKNRLYLHKVRQCYSRVVRLVMLLVSYTLLVMGLVLYIKVHKDVSTYIGFASGLVYYMIGFVIFKEMRSRRVFFSFRLIAFDSLGILLLVACSKLYPILHYQIPNLYMLVGALLITSILLIYGGITYILVNVIKYDSELQDTSQLTLDHESIGKEPSRHNFVSTPKNSKQTTNEKEEMDGGLDGNWKKLTQQSMASQVPNNSIIEQEIKFSMRAQI